MLDPRSRHLYLDLLKPPDGYRLDKAIATTYSLDLITLLAAPLSMAFRDSSGIREARRDSIAVMEALQRTTGSIAVFCQKGGIAIPKVGSRLLSYLEKCVVEVQAPRRNGIFHPKIWLLRFVADEEAPYYRFLCLSRNLTSDRSWDTALALEGPLVNRKNAFGRNRPLADFIGSLPAMADDGASEAVHELVELLGDEVLRVRFETPGDFGDDIEFIPSGIGRKKPVEPGDYSRAMVVSPFFSNSEMRRLTLPGNNNVVISRLDTLDAASEETIRDVGENTSLFFLNEGAEVPDNDSENAGDTPEVPEEKRSGNGAQSKAAIDAPRLSSVEVKGLHAKLYVFESGSKAVFFTGSANATNSAMAGRNVEFMVRLVGDRKKIGIDRLLGDEDEDGSFRGLLEEYIRSATPEEEDRDAKLLQDDLEKARASLARAHLSLVVTADPKGTYSLVLRSKEPIQLGRGEISGHCYPITLRKDEAGLDLVPLFKGHSLEFKAVPLVSITSFIAFELTAHRKKQKESIGLVLNVPVEGIPTDRDSEILRSLISSRELFMKYLLFLLADDSRSEGIGEIMRHITGNSTPKSPRSSFDVPLLEELLRAYSRRPERIRIIDKRISDLKSAGEFEEIIPEGFDEIWSAFITAVDEGASNE